jgi:hypothetical protein
MGEMKPADQFTSTEEEVEVDEETLAARQNTHAL